MCRTVLCRVESVHISELNAEVRERKAHGLGDGCKSHAGPLLHETLRFLQAKHVPHQTVYQITVTGLELPVVLYMPVFPFREAVRVLFLIELIDADT